MYNSIAIFAKKSKSNVNEVISYLKEHFDKTYVFLGEKGDKIPEKAYSLNPDILISYISPWIVPKIILDNTKYWNINFHPGSPEYPGIGCTNFALYNNEKIFGVIAHIMEAKVDTGKIIGIKRFPIIKSDTVYSLTLKSYGYLFNLFFEIIDFIILNKKLPDCYEIWQRNPYTRKELEELCKIDINMDTAEIARRIRATYYPQMPGAYFNIEGMKFEYNPNR